MADVVRFTDPANDGTVRLDISTYIAGENPPDWGIPTDDRRRIVLHLDLSAANKVAMLQIWHDIVKEIERGSALEVLLDGQSAAVWFDLLVTSGRRLVAPLEDRSNVVPLYDWIEGFQSFLKVRLELVCKPFGRGAPETAVADVTVDNSPEPNNHVTIPTVLGDVEAPADVEIDLGASTPNRMTTLIARRSKGVPANFKSLLQYDGTFTLGAGTTVDGGGFLKYSPSDAGAGLANSMNRLASWRINTNLPDNTGLLQVYVVVKDDEEVAGNLKMRMDLAFEDLAEGLPGPTVRIVCDDAHISQNQDLQAYELHYLGTFAVPDKPSAPSVWYWRLFVQRTTDVDPVRVKRVMLLPVDESPLVIDWDADRNVTADADAKFSVSTEEQRAWWGSLTNFKVPAIFGGRGLWLRPGFSQDLIVASAVDLATALDHDPPTIDNPAAIVGVTVKYRPRYLFLK